LLGDDVSNIADTNVSANNNDADVDRSVSDVQPTVDNVVMQGINNNYRDVTSSHSKLCNYFPHTTYLVLTTFEEFY